MLKDLRIDAAAHGFDNVSFLKLISLILFYPAMRMLFNFRLQQRIGGKSSLARFIRRALWMKNCRASACHIYFDAIIEPGVRFCHPTGIVIGKGVVIESGVSIYQNVTLGTKYQENEEFPTIKSGAIIYAGAVIAGNVTIGENAVIKANSVISKNIPVVPKKTTKKTG